MGYYFGVTAELVAIVTLSLIQWQLCLLAISYIYKHLSSGRARVLHGLVVVAAALLAFGLLLSLPEAARLPINPKVFGWLRGGALIWTFTTTPAWIVLKLLRLARRKSDDVDPARRALLRTAGGAALAAPFVAFGFGTFVERTAFGVREVDIPVPGLHPDLEGLRLVQLSDIHLSPYLSEEEFARVVDASNELRAHILFVTGDLISMRGDPLDACFHQIARLRSEAGMLGCLGNHEIYAGTEDYTAAQGARLGIPFLRSQARQLRFGNALINIAGVDYQRMNWRSHYLQGAERLIVPGALNLLLSHNPDVLPAAARQGWDVTLAGHTHGGQVNVEILHQDFNLARFYTPYIHGLYRSGRSSIYVTRGIGTIGMPARLGAPPEISLLRLRKA
jgi:predicted MPP superfamily phosphohydrolase